MLRSSLNLCVTRCKCCRGSYPTICQTECYLLVPPATFCFLLLLLKPSAASCSPLLFPATSYFMLLPSSTHCHLPQPPAIVTIHAIHLLPSTLSPGIVSRWQRLKIKRCRITKQAALLELLAREQSSQKYKKKKYYSTVTYPLTQPCLW